MADNIDKFDLSKAPMDTELARTFLAVVTVGNFVNAAERLHVTQSTVSTRIRTLETVLGRRLFVRNKGGTTLTAAGRISRSMPPRSFGPSSRRATMSAWRRASAPA
jgi:hypothetical protein